MYLPNYIDLSIVIIFLGFCLIIGLIKARGVTTLKQFALGYQNVTITVLVCTIFASSIGANSTISGVNDLYDFGIIFVIVQLIKPLQWYVTSKIFASNIERFRGCITLSDIMYKLYGVPGRWFSAVASIIMCIAIVSVQAIAIGELLHYFFHISVDRGILIGCGIFTAYSTMGGIRSIVPTEIFKFAIFLFVVPITYSAMFTEFGSFTDVIIPKLPTSHTNFKLLLDNKLFIAGLIFTALLPTYTAPFMQRYLIANSSKQLIQSLKLVGFLYFTFCVAISIVAYITKAYFPNVAPYQELFVYIANLLPTGAVGLVIAGLLAAFMSSAEAHTSSVGVIITHDIIRPIKQFSPKREMLILRLSVAMLSLISVLLALSGKQILELVWTAATFWHSSMLIPITAGFLGFKTTSRSFTMSLICSIATVIATRTMIGKFGAVSLFFGVLASALGLSASHYYQILKGCIVIEKVEKRYSKPKLSSSQLCKQFMLKPLIFIKDKFIDSNINISQFCTFTLAYYLIYSFNISNQPGFKQMGYMICIGYFFCLILIFRDFIFSKKIIKKCMPLYCNVLITYCLPFVSSYMLFATEKSVFWITNFLIVNFSLFYLLDTSRFLLFSIIGLILGCIAFICTDNYLPVDHLYNTLIYVSYVVTLFLFICIFFARKKERDQHEREENLQLLGGAIAHEVISPIASMQMTSQTISQIISDLVSNAKKPNKDGVTNLKVDQETLEMILQFIANLNTTGDKGVKTVNSILMALKSAVVAQDKATYNIGYCVNKTLEEYNSSYSDMRMRIDVNIEDDFSLVCSAHYVMHVILNILKNAFKYAGRHQAKVEIFTVTDGGYNELHIKDNGKGISPEDCERIFDRFFTKSQSGTGIGLAFCKMVMDDLEGEIRCESELGKYTDFTLCFPKLVP